MKKILIYTKDYCPYCMKAKNMLKQNGLDFEEINMTSPAEFDELMQRTGVMTVPQIFVGDELIGGSDDLDKRIKEVIEMVKA